MDPVAPRTVTARTPDAAGLLLRNGTPLIVSPNHKTGADAIRATTQKSKNSSQNDGGDEAVKAVQHAAMPGNDVTGILYAEAAFHCRLEEIAQLRSNGQKPTQQQERHELSKLKCREPGADDEARH